MFSNRPVRPARGLWAEIALALSLITLSTILLNAGVFWLLLKRTEEARRTELVQSLSEALTVQLELAGREEDSNASMKQVLSAYRGIELDFESLLVVDTSLNVVASVVGEPPPVADLGFRTALYGEMVHTEVTGTLWGLRWVSVTAPVQPYGRPTAALRVTMPLKAPGIPGRPGAFVLLYTVISGGLIALFGFDLFRRRLIRPVGSLKASTVRIAGGEFAHRSHVDAATELQDLSLALNAMAGSLEEYQSQTVKQVARLKQSNQELQRTQEALIRSEKLAGVGRLAAGLAHEVGNPLAAVVGYVDLLAGGLDDLELEKDLIHRARQSLDRIHRIIQALLDYARPKQTQVADVDVAREVEDAASIVLMRPDFRDVIVEVQAADCAATVSIEPDKLHQMLVNMLVNAGHAVQGRPNPWIRVQVTLDEDWVEIRCEDNGTGFSNAALEQALEPFFTTKEVGKGTGLGLATCLQIAESVGGSIILSNRMEGGACVRVLMPCSLVA